VRIKNTTSLDNDVVHAIVAIICKGVTRNIGSVQFRKAKAKYSGCCDYGMWHQGARIIVRIGQGFSYPFTMNSWHYKYYPRFEVYDEIELAIAVLAHEVYHLKAHISRGHLRNTQIRAERYAMRTLQRFRDRYFEESACVPIVFFSPVSGGEDSE